MSQCSIIRPHMWSGTECGTQCGNSGFVRTHAIQPECNVRHGTGYVRTMWGSCAAQYSLSYIEYCHPTPTHVTYDGVGALYAFPLHAKQGDIFFVLPRPIRQDSIIGSYTCGQFLFYKISAHQPLISDASSCGTYTPPDECSDPGTDRVSLGLWVVIEVAYRLMVLIPCCPGRIYRFVVSLFRWLE